MLELKNLRLTAEDGQGKVDILKDVSLSVADGEFLVITGPNGGGKTSLAKTVMGLMQPSSGQIFWNGGHAHSTHRNTGDCQSRPDV